MLMKNRRQAGYSLAEMLTVVAIVGTLALVTVPAFITFYQSNKMKSSIRNFTTDLRSIRQRAITRGVQVAMCYQPSAASAAPVNQKRTYTLYQGNLPNNSDSWSPILQPGQTTAAVHSLENTVYFPAHDATLSPQNFTDRIDCSTNPCTNTASTDGKLDVIFFPDGRAWLPAGPPAVTLGKITIQTDMRIPTKKYVIEIQPSGSIKATAP